MRVARQIRFLSDAEVAEAAKVFQKSLPPWMLIRVTDGLGPAPGLDNPYTDAIGYFYNINVGPVIYDDLLRGITFSGFGIDRNIFIHEMTHVWQYYHGSHVVLSSIWANAVERLGGPDAYRYPAGLAWDSYNVEQQAQLVEDWYNARKGNMSTQDDRFVYIDKIIRPGLDKGGFFSKHFEDIMVIKSNAAELKKL